MKTKLFLLAVIGISALTITADESTDFETTYYDPGKFYSLIINANANVVLTQGGENSVRIEGGKNELKGILTDVENGALTINGGKEHAVTIYITAEEINLIEINGSARLYASGSINSDILLLKINGNGSMKVDVRTLSLGMIVKGGGKIIVSGSSGDCYQRIYEKGNIYSDKLYSFNHAKERFALKDDNSFSKRSTLKLQK